MDEKIIKKTQESLGKIITKPPLTSKLLNKPPFRFLHDIISEVIRTSNFLQGLYTSEEMDSKMVTTREAKIAFLQKAISCTSIVRGSTLSARPTKIVAGGEPENTNEFLQALARCVRKNMSSDEAVKQVLSGDIPEKSANNTSQKGGNEKESGESDRRHKKEHRSREDREKSKHRSRDEKDGEKNEDREKSKRRSRDHKDGERSEKSREDKERRRREKSDAATEEKSKSREEREKSSRHREEREKSKHGEEQEKSKHGEEREKSKHREDREKSKHREKSSRGKDDKEKSRDDKDKSKHGDEKDKSKDEAAAERREQRRQERKKRHEKERKEKSEQGDKAEGSKDEEKKSREEKKAREEKKKEEKKAKEEETAVAGEDPATTRAQRPASAKGQRRRPQTRNSGRNNEIMNEPSTTEEIPPAAEQVVTASRKLVRPPSARPSAPRVRRNNPTATNEDVETSGQEKVATIIADTDQNMTLSDEEDAQFVVQEDKTTEDAIDMLAPSLSNVNGEELNSEEHGGLVRKILETKKELEGSASKQKISHTEIRQSNVVTAQQQKEQQLVVKEIEQLRESVQKLCQSSAPLAKLIDYSQEDMDAMHNELQMWRKENKQHDVKIKEDNNVTALSIEPLKAELQELDQAIAVYRTQMAATKANIIRNEDKIQKMMIAVATRS